MDYFIRRMEKADNPYIENIIATVMTEFGAVGPGYSIEDPEVKDMFTAYQIQGSCYFVCGIAENILGGGGIAPLNGGADHICELRKMYFLPEIRGLGLGRKLLSECISFARQAGYRSCYLESLERMEAARGLYTSFGFKPLDTSWGTTGHSKCDTYMELSL